MRSYVVIGAVLLAVLAVIAYEFHYADHESQQAAAPTYHDFTLSNGMRVLLVPNHRIPAVNHTIWLKLGSADEPLGQSGVAHYLEHLMFKGSKHLASGEYSRQIERMGGEHNAFIGRDFTGYYATIAVEHLEALMKLEVERLKNLKPSADEYKEERQVILEERNMRIDNNPGALLSEEMRTTLFRHHPYRIPIIGWKHEMEALTLEQAMAFYDRYYHPANFVLVVTGDITPEQLKPLAEKYYGSISAGEHYERNWVQEPPMRGPKLLRYSHPQVKQREWARYYMAPSLATEGSEHALPLTLLAHVMGGSQTSLLYQSLVVEQKLASDISVDYSGVNAGPSVFAIGATPADGVSMDVLGAAIDAEIEKIRTTPVPADDVLRAQTQYIAAALYAREGLNALGNFIGQLAISGIDLSIYADWAELIENISTADMLEAASETLVPKNSVTGYLLTEDAPKVTDESNAGGAS